MSETDVRDNSCENCAKFSHCNNNDLVCIRKFQQLKKYCIDICDSWMNLSNQYKQCLAEIEGIAKGTCRKRCTNDCLGTKKHCGYGKIIQLIKEVKDGNQQ